MNKILLQQLQKTQVDLSNYDEDTCTYTIPKINSIKLEVGSYYLIELADALLNSTSLSMLVSNWNHGTHPISKYYKVDISAINGKMIKVVGLGYDPVNNKDLDMWSGWLPINHITVIQKF